MTATHCFGRPRAALRLRALVLTTMWCLAAAARQLHAPQDLTLGGTAAVLAWDLHTSDEQRSQRTVYLHTDEGLRVRLVEAVPGQHAGLHTGQRVRVSGRWVGGAGGSMVAAAAGAPSTPAFRVTATQAVGGGSRPQARAQIRRRPSLAAGRVSGNAAADAAAPALPLTSNALIAADVSTLVVPLAGVTPQGGACPGAGLPTTTVAQVRAAVLGDGSGNATSVSAVFGRCSLGRSRLNGGNSRVAPLVKLPCAGNSGGVPWTFSKCDYDDFNGWADAADAQLAAQGVQLSQYAHRVYLVPPGTCTFVGLAYIGCDGSFTCRAWIGAGFWDSPNAIAHELMHHLYLAHAGAPLPGGGVDEYGDASSAMGFCCQQRCPNTPQAWQLGWATLQQLDAGSLRPGQTVQLRLASQATAQQSGLRVDVASWVAGVDPVFVGFRTAERGDRGLTPEVAGRVSVYTSAIRGSYDALPTLWQAAMTAGQSWTQPASGLVVRHRGMAGGGALVSVCRRGGAETVASCAAGTDNDCNGLAGTADPACAALLPARP